MLYLQNNKIYMDSFELNKIIAAILMVALLVIGLGKVADGVFHVNKPENPGYQVEVEGQPASTISQVAEVEQKVDIAAIMALGDVTSGEKIFKKCAACHSIEKGGPNKIGPALYGIVGKASLLVESSLLLIPFLILKYSAFVKGSSPNLSSSIISDKCLI